MIQRAIWMAAGSNTVNDQIDLTTTAQKKSRGRSIKNGPGFCHTPSKREQSGGGSEQNKPCWPQSGGADSPDGQEKRSERSSPSISGSHSARLPSQIASLLSDPRPEVRTAAMLVLSELRRRSGLRLVGE